MVSFFQVLLATECLSPCPKAILLTPQGVLPPLTRMLIPPDFYLSSHGELSTPRFTQRWPQLLGNSRTHKRSQQAPSSRLPSGVLPQPSIYNVKASSDLSFNKRLHSRPQHNRHRHNKDTSNIHSTATISNIRIKLRLQLPHMDTSRRTVAERRLETRVARAGSLLSHPSLDQIVNNRISS